MTGVARLDPFTSTSGWRRATDAASALRPVRLARADRCRGGKGLGESLRRFVDRVAKSLFLHGIFGFVQGANADVAEFRPELHEEADESAALQRGRQRRPEGIGRRKIAEPRPLAGQRAAPARGDGLQEPARERNDLSGLQEVPLGRLGSSLDGPNEATVGKRP